jgi:protein NDRG1
MLSPYSTVVEKVYKELDKDKVTILKVDKTGDVLAESVSTIDIHIIVAPAKYEI